MLAISFIFRFFGHFDDVTVGERNVGSTFGFGFPAQEKVNRLTCGGDFLVPAYFQSGERSKVVKKSCSA